MIALTIDNNITLRSYQPEDAPALFNLVNGDRAHLNPWLSWVSKTTKEEHSLQFIQESLHQLRTQEGLALGIFYDNILIGGIGMHNWDQATRRTQIGYWIGKQYEGKSIVHKSLICFIDYLFTKAGLNKIEIHFVPTNTRSAKVAEKLGFKIEGIIRQSIIRNGMPEDIVVTGLLKNEWSLISV